MHTTMGCNAEVHVYATGFGDPHGQLLPLYAIDLKG